MVNSVLIAVAGGTVAITAPVLQGFRGGLLPCIPRVRNVVPAVVRNIAMVLLAALLSMPLLSLSIALSSLLTAVGGVVFQVPRLLRV